MIKSKFNKIFRNNLCDMLIRKNLKSKELIIAFIAKNENHLTDVELNKCKYAQNSSRYFDWLRGRSALKKVITYLNKDLDVTKISFPHPFLSLSHTKNCAVALGILNSGNAVKGIGIDLELDRKVSTKHTKFYLNEFESDLKNNNDHRLRLWTVKEALFKADPNNDSNVLKDYIVKDPETLSGKAINKKGHTFHYKSIKNPADQFLGEHRGGWMSLAFSI